LRRLFLDANVLFSASWRKDAGFLRFWRLADVELVTSRYAVEEVLRNLDDPEVRTRLKNLLIQTTIVAEGDPDEVPALLALVEKDRPILAAAIRARATHLITGDRRDFGKLFGKTVRGVLIVRPGDYE
jgi:predicted nucleic acid-binding protein